MKINRLETAATVICVLMMVAVVLFMGASLGGQI